MNEDPESTRTREKHLFLFICIVFFPLLSIVLVGGYGFIIWMSQLILGPPTI